MKRSIQVGDLKGRGGGEGFGIWGGEEGGDLWDIPLIFGRIRVRLLPELRALGPLLTSPFSFPFPLTGRCFSSVSPYFSIKFLVA